MSPFRAEALQAGERFYADAGPCDFCGTNKRYSINGSCVACAVARGKHRYASLDKTAREAQAARDRARYLTRKTANA
jgi:hypothetical protein